MPESLVWPIASQANPLLLRLLELSRYFLSQPTRALALGVIKARQWGFNPSLMIQICFEYHTRILFSAAFHRLTSMYLRELTQDDIDNMGSHVYIALTKVKEDVQRHRQIVAAEEFPIEHHAYTCSDKAACERDWHAVWWNGMGRFLLDGRNPLTWTVAMERFEAFNFGEMDVECRATMLKLVRSGDAYCLGYDLVTVVANHLMEGIAEETGDGGPLGL